MLKNNMLKSTAISDAGLTKQSLYEVEKSLFTRSTYDRAMELLEAVNSAIATSFIDRGAGEMIATLSAVHVMNFANDPDRFFATRRD